MPTATKDPREIVFDRKEFDDDIFVGEQFEGPSIVEENQTMLYAITKITDDTVTLDANHPLAGMEVVFEATVLDVREATNEELEHGHIHENGECC